MLAVVVLPGSAAGQDTASSWVELQGAGGLRRGTSVYVTDTNGQRVKGTIRQVSPTGLTIARGEKTWALADREIAKIDRQDPIWTGVVIGAGVGYAGVLAYCLGGDYSHCFAAGIYAYPFVASAAALGALFDGCGSSSSTPKGLDTSGTARAT